MTQRRISELDEARDSLERLERAIRTGRVLVDGRAVWLDEASRRRAVEWTRPQLVKRIARLAD